MAYSVSYREVIAIRAFLGYLHRNYSKQIGTTDTYLIAAVAAWSRTASGGHIAYNNPFELRAPTTTRVILNEETGERRTVPVPGKLLRFASLAEGFVAAAKALVKGVPNKLSGYVLALNALKRGGNQAAVDFLAALAMSQFDVLGYGVANWQDAYNKDRNKLLGVYVQISGVQLSPRQPNKPRTRPAKQPAKLPRDYNFRPITREYIDPWAAGVRYQSRHRSLDTSTSKR